MCPTAKSLPIGIVTFNNRLHCVYLGQWADGSERADWAQQQEQGVPAVRRQGRRGALPNLRSLASSPAYFFVRMLHASFRVLAVCSHPGLRVSIADLGTASATSALPAKVPCTAGRGGGCARARVRGQSAQGAQGGPGAQGRVQAGGHAHARARVAGRAGAGAGGRG